MSDEEAGGVWFWFEFWLSWFFPPFWFVVGVMLGAWWDIRVVVWYSFVVLMYLRDGLSRKRLVELFVVS